MYKKLILFLRETFLKGENKLFYGLLCFSFISFAFDLTKCFILSILLMVLFSIIELIILIDTIKEAEK